MRSCVVLNRKAVYRYATRFLGYGNPDHAKVWFAGLEDVCVVGSQKQLRNLPKRVQHYRHVIDESAPSVYTLISKVITSLKGDGRSTEWRHYKSRILFQPDCDAFLTNLYPLGKPLEQDWPCNYRKWLDMTSEQYYAWIQSDELPRFEFLRRCRMRRGEPLTICFGKKHWPHFIRCFATPGDSVANIGRFGFIPARNLVLTEFFRSTRMPDSSIGELVGLINSFSMNPFRARLAGKQSCRQKSMFHAAGARGGPLARSPCANKIPRTFSLQPSSHPAACN